MAQMSQQAYGAVTSPAANATICSLTPAVLNLQLGQIWQINCRFYYTGTPASPNDDDNWQLNINGGVNIYRGLISVAATIQPETMATTTLVTNVGSAFILRCASNAGTAGSVYHGLMTATLIDSQGIVLPT